MAVALVVGAAAVLGRGGGAPSVAGSGAPLPDGLVPPGAPAPQGFLDLPGPARRDVAVNWTAFADSNLWSAGSARYVAWVAPDGAPMIARAVGAGDRSARAGGGGAGGERGAATPPEVADLAEVPGNPLGAPIAVDPHNVLAVGVDAAGYVHVAGNMHSGRLRYLRSAAPGRIDEWLVAPMVGADEGAVTYPSFTPGPRGSLLFSYRDGSSADGALVLDTLPAGATRWRRTATVLAGGGSAAPYPHRLVVDGGTIHLFHTWRTGPGAGGNTAVAYVASDDGGTTWRTVSGAGLEVPVGIDERAFVATVDDVGGGVIVNGGGAAVDGAGRPHALLRVRGPGPSRPGLWLASPVEGTWRVRPLPGTEGASGRAALAAGEGSGLVALWPARAGSSTELVAAEVSDGDAADDRTVVAALPVGEWEPTLDAPAARRGELCLVVPVGDGDATSAGVVWWRTRQLAGRRRRQRPLPAPVDRGGGGGAGAGGAPGAAAQAHRSSSSSSARPSSTMVSPHTPTNLARCSWLQRSPRRGVAPPSPKLELTRRVAR